MIMNVSVETKEVWNAKTFCGMQRMLKYTDLWSIVNIICILSIDCSQKSTLRVQVRVKFSLARDLIY